MMKCIKLKLKNLKLIFSNKVAQVSKAGHSFGNTLDKAMKPCNTHVNTDHSEVI